MTVEEYNQDFDVLSLLAPKMVEVELKTKLVELRGLLEV